MPKIDPVTGCEVLTFTEFWQGEAAREGKGRSGSDLFAEFKDEMNAEMERAEREMRTPEKALEILTKAVQEWNDADPDATESLVPTPLEVLEVLEVTAMGNLSTTGTHLRARVRTAQGLGIIDFTESYWGGSRMTPPEYDCNIIWEAA